MDKTQDVRIIKKYPNRRLYDTVERKYIKLDEIKEIVLNHIPFQVIDVKTNKDVTQTVLLQIIHEQETVFSPLFTNQILQNIIRFYGNPMQKTMSQFLEQSFSSLAQPSTFDSAAQTIQQNISLWQSFFEKTAPNKK